MKDFKLVHFGINTVKLKSREALELALYQTSSFAKQELTNRIYERYNFNRRSYVADRLVVDVDTRYLQFSVSARHRVSSAIHFIESPVYRRSKNKRTPNKQVLAGYTGSFLRGKTSHWKGAFVFTGLKGNTLLGYRDGQRTRNVPEVPYGPSVMGAMVNIRDDAVDPVMQHLSKMYQKAL